MASVIAAATGLVLALYVVALGNGLAALFWPRAAFGVLVLAALAGGLAALGLAAAPARWGEQVRRHAAVVLGLAAVLALAAFPAMRMIATEIAPGAGPLALPFLFLGLVAAPLALAASVLCAWVRAGERRRVGRLLAGAGAGWLVAAAIAGTPLPLRAPWFGGHELERAQAGGGSPRLAIDRGLREFVAAPAAPMPLAFLPTPEPGGPAEALAVGLPDGQVLAALLGAPDLRLTVLEEDRALVAAVLRDWPALEAARAAGRVRFRFGNPRRTLESGPGRYGLIALSPGWTPAAHLSRALALRGDQLWTVEAFRAYLSRLRPEGYLFAQRAAVGRVVTTLREAAALPTEAFAERLVVFGNPGGIVSQCWYRPAGLADRASHRTTILYGTATGTHVLYRPSKRPMNSIYDLLVKAERPRGTWFSTPLDLSPPLDERPFFDHLDRLTISPSGRALPEEPATGVPGGALRIIPPGDRDLWAVMLAGAAAALVLLVLGAHRGRRTAGPGAPLAPALPAGLLLGACASLALEAFRAWTLWLEPSATAGLAAFGAALLGSARGWRGLPPRPGADAGLPALGVALLLFVLGGYRIAPLAARLGPAAAALALIAAGAFLGLALGRALGSAAARLDGTHAGAAGVGEGAALAAAALVWPAARLAATHFGYRLIWALAAVAAFGALRCLRRLPGGGPGDAPT